MNIKQAEVITGISKRNIRFYEKEKLIFPKRNSENDYREYSEEDIYNRRVNSIIGTDMWLLLLVGLIFVFKPEKWRFFAYLK